MDCLQAKTGGNGEVDLLGDTVRIAQCQLVLIWIQTGIRTAIDAPAAQEVASSSSPYRYMDGLACFQPIVQFDGPWITSLGMRQQLQNHFMIPFVILPSGLNGFVYAAGHLIAGGDAG
ncbi:hypothetical protein ACP87_20745 [Pseudomonas oleovorans]|nr:hypothetical protein [Pseudomonas oleovorans]MBN7132965.1 hypothetical protein [Pseudomonas oleovorans]MBN7141473.1 hypothetical protein [Pseudomonas oleovorans]